MSDRERAYRVLGLASDAAPEEVEEAYHDLKAVWHPDRFADSPELRSKAEHKQAEVERSYQILRGVSAETKRSPEGSAVLSTGESAERSRGPSLLDDTLSERMGRTKKRYPVWIGVFVVVALAVIVNFLTWSPIDVDSEAELSEQERIVADVKAARSNSEEGTDEEEPIDRAQEETPLSPEQSPASERPPVARPEPAIVAAPATPAPKVVQSSPASRNTGGTAQTAPAGELETKPQETVEPEVAVEEEPAVSELAERSFQILLAKSDLANQLVEGTLEEYSYKEWKAVERSSTEVYVDLVAETASQEREVHFVWAVDTEAQSVKPMSQAARDLQASER